MSWLFLILTAAVAFFVRWLPIVWQRPHARVLAFVSAAVVGMAVMDLAIFAPTRHWHWLPLIVVLAWAVATLKHCVTTPIYTAPYCSFCYGASWCLVPNWSQEMAPRSVQVVLFAVYLTVGWSLSDLHVQRVNSTEWILASLTALLSVSICVTAAVSMHYGQLGLIASVALAITALPIRWPEAGDWLRVVYGPVFMATAAAAWIGLVEPQPPLFALAFLPIVLFVGLLWNRSTFANSDSQEASILLSPLAITLTLLLSAAVVAFILWPSGAGVAPGDDW